MTEDLYSKEELDELERLAELDAEYDDEYTPSVTGGDYSASCPWLAPGMRVSDFI